MVGIVAAGLVFWHSPYRRRGLDTDVAGSSVHIEPRPGDFVPGVVVLDVGGARSDPRRAYAGDPQNRVRSRPITKGFRAFSRGLIGVLRAAKRPAQFTMIFVLKTRC